MWTRPGGIGEGYLNTYRTPGAVYLLSKGLYRLNPESGVGWFFETSLSHRAVAEAYAKDAAMACIGAFAGYNYYGHSQEKLTHNITSQPLEVDDKVYFAARKKLFCLEAKSGKVLWQTELPREAGSMQLYEAGPNIALIGSGWVYEDFQIVESAAPSISLFRRESGEEVGRVELTDSKILLDFRWLDSYAFALSPDQLYRLGRDLTIESSRKPTVAEGEFLRFLLPTTEELFIRCDRGVLCLGQSDLEQRWFDDLGSVRSSLKNSSKWAPALSLMTATVDVGRSYACGSMCWLTNGTGMIEGLDLSDGGKVQAKLDLSTKDLWYAGDGNFIALRDNQAFIIPVNKACKTLPEDSDKPDEMRELCAIDIYFCTPQLPLSPRYLPVLSLSPRARRWS